MDTTPKISPERTKRQSLAFGRNLIVLALLILAPGLWGAAHGALALRWPRTEATIIDADLTRHALPTSSTPHSTGAEKMREAVSSKAHVAYDLDDAEVEPGPCSFSLVLTGIGAVIGLSGLWIRSLARRGIGRMAT